ncbi:amidohydrolase family protein [Pseudoteredinibacter isoporae]|uniref:Imidazolonepropionase-like amidohydrolase n=1 Tax=Pseudoteredinibacter isoporae TaxID=570281 RepID=A0A7X0JU25_9GAMM|nr:amidohydrolase family protein [Pseudoteredinibacter isoporae]MBB6522268.1 imidazolonepropionase-like amidohydrolase [Pseudoteredinibacter isoporae]NHO87801.1 amidohydrolase family protein [Pseudoteredinibacter isoporae]NIB23868.1 amidohydrolase family protein [Pseudoteredinibacter isoporae]
MKKTLLTFAISLLGFQQASANITIYQNVNLIDSIDDKLQSDMAIVVDGETISAVLPMSQLEPGNYPKAKVVDAQSWYATPGLIETHTHVATQPNRQYAEFILNRQLYGGITTARDLAGDARALADLSRAALVKEIPAPDLKYVALMAGPEFFSDPRTVSSGLGEVPGKISWMQAIDDNSDMKTAVALARGTWASAIKTYAKLDDKAMKRIGDEARKQGIPVWSHAHVGPARPMAVAKARVHSMSHACDMAAAAFTEEQLSKAETGELNGRVPVDLNSPEIDAVFEEMKKHNTVFDPTLRVEEWVTNNAEKLKAQREKMAKEMNENPNAKGKASTKKKGIRARCGFDGAVNLVRRAYKAGVRISTGTDGWTGNKDTFPALYDELRLLNEKVGMPMMDVIKAATINGAYSIGLEKNIGTIEAGKLANISFFQQNPLDGSDKLRSVTLTVKRGSPYYRKDFVLGESGVPDEDR